MRNKYLLFLLGAGLLLSLTGCEKEASNDGGDPQGVRFTVTTGSPETKTHYTGEGTGEAGNLSWERISWNQGDPILIWSDYAIGRTNEAVHSAQYAVGKPYHVDESGNYPNQSWSIVNDNANLGLIYNDDHTGAYKFWAIYPAVTGDNAPAGGEGTDANKVTFQIPATQEKSGDADGPTITRMVNNVSTSFKVDSLKPDMTKAFMLAAVEGAAYNSDVILKFYPAYTAFEFELLTADEELTLGKVELTSTIKNGEEEVKHPLAGTVTAAVAPGTRNDAGSGNYIGASTYGFTATSDKLTFNFPSGTKLTPAKTVDGTTTPGKGVIFTVFALPQDLTGLTLEFFDADGISFAKGELKYNGNPITFAACKKHCIRGINVKNSWKFTYLTLDINVLDWIEEKSTFSNGSGVQATQFAVSVAGDPAGETIEHNLRYVKNPNDKDYRQCWVFTKDNTVTVTYKIMMPTSGTWSIEKCGDTGSFTVNVTSSAGAVTTSGTEYSGALSSEGATYITMTITSSEASAVKTLYFKTFVSDGTDTFSLDSETQLYDLRGYHYFIVNGTASTTWSDLNIN